MAILLTCLSTRPTVTTSDAADVTHSSSDEQLLDDMVARIAASIGPSNDFVPLHAPEFLGNEHAFVNDCIATGWVSSVGSYVDRFESAVAAACDAEFGVAVVNGTAALELAMNIVGVRRGDEVLMPTLTFVATANAAHHLGAVPHFVDSNEETLGIDAESLSVHLRQIGERRPEGLYNRKTGRRIACVLPMHVFGHSVDIHALSAVCEEFGLDMVEDAAEALGSRYHGRACGSFGRIAAISFNGNKIVTTGGGGAIVTNDAELAQRAKHLSTTAKRPHPWAFDHDEPGYNYRLPNLNAALGVAQLEQLPERLKKKRKLAQRYIEVFDNFSGGEVFREPGGCTSNYWLNTLVLSKDISLSSRDFLLNGVNARGYMVRPVWNLMHTLPFHCDCPRASLRVAESLERRLINLPSSAMLAGNL